jgi:hypothetical protein
MGISFALLWQLFVENGVNYNFTYFLLWSLVFYLGLTNFSVPYVAMGYEQTRLMVTTNLSFVDWPQIFGDDERLAGALLDRLTHHVHVIEIIAKSFRLNASLKNNKRAEKVNHPNN